MILNHSSRRTGFLRQRRANVRMPVIVGLCLLAITGLLACRFIFSYFNRSGEQAINLIPSDALVVVTLDMRPSPKQLLTYRQIEKSLKDEHLDTQFNQWMNSNLGNDKSGKDLKKVLHYWKQSFAFAAFHKPNTPAGSDPAFVVLAAVSDPGAVRELLAKDGHKANLHGMEYYAAEDGQGGCALISDYLVMSDSADLLERVEHVAKGQEKSITTLPHYREARAALPSDANLMVFVSPAGLEELNAKTASGLKTMASNALKTPRWLAAGLTLAPNGVEVTTQAPFDGVGGVKLPTAAAPLRADWIARHLPAGAYGVASYSQPGRMWDWVQMAMQQDAKSGQSLNDGIASFEKQTGLSVANDVLPALKGDLLFAVYPDASMQGVQGVDGVLVLDNANGATPVALEEKLRALVERESAKTAGQEIRFVTTQSNGATIIALDPATDAKLHGSSSDNGAAGKTAEADESQANGTPRLMTASAVQAPINANTASSVSGQPNSDPAGALKNKTFVCALVDNSVIMASSRPMLDRALAAFQTGRHTLADDPHYRTMLSTLPTGTQANLMISAPQIIAALHPLLESNFSQGTGLTLDDYTGIFGTNGGCAGSYRYDGQAVTSTFTLYLDYTKLIHVIGALSKQAMTSAGPAQPSKAQALPPPQSTTDKI
jgi:hypothetical protein